MNQDKASPIPHSTTTIYLLGTTICVTRLVLLPGEKRQDAEKQENGLKKVQSTDRNPNPPLHLHTAAWPSTNTTHRTRLVESGPPIGSNLCTLPIKACPAVACLRSPDTAHMHGRSARNLKMVTIQPSIHPPTCGAPSDLSRTKSARLYHALFRISNSSSSRIWCQRPVNLAEGLKTLFFLNPGSLARSGGFKKKTVGSGPKPHLFFFLPSALAVIPRGAYSRSRTWVLNPRQSSSANLFVYIDCSNEPISMGNRYSEFIQGQCPTSIGSHQ